MTAPLRLVVGEPRLCEGRGSVLGPDTTRRTRWWEGTLECGHGFERTVKYAKREARYPRARRLDDVLDPPKRVRCHDCRLANSDPKGRP